MKVSKIKEFATDFVQWVLETDQLHFDAYDAQHHWQTHWERESDDPVAMFDQALHSTLSGQLWGGSVNSAKEVMLLLWDADKHFMRETFDNLFNEQKDLGLRLDRFIFHVSELFDHVTKARKKVLSHHHENRSMALLYLALQYPEQYALWQYDAFVHMMELLEARNIPHEVEVDRYFKSLRGINNYLIKEHPEVIQALAFRLADRGISFRPTLMIMNDWMAYLASK